VSRLSLEVEVLLAGLLFGSLWFAFLGPPPRRRASSAAVATVGGLGVATCLGGLVLAHLSPPMAGISLALGVGTLCVAGWLGRGGGGGGGGGGGDDGPGPPHSGPGLDWEAFDRARRDWEHPRTPA